MAVCAMVSWQGNHTRFERLAESGTPVRVATREVHATGVAGCRETLAKIERESLADRVTVVARSGDVLYTNERRAGQWTKPAQAAESLRAFRDRPMTSEEAPQRYTRWSEVLGHGRTPPCS